MDLLPQSRSTENMQQVGNSYIRDLVSMSFLKAGRKESCFVMPDIMHELARYFAGEFTWTGDGNWSKTLNHSDKVRYFSYCQNELTSSDQLNVLTNLSQFRTFLPFRVGDSVCSGSVLMNFKKRVLPKLKRVRTLSIAGFSLQRFPDSVLEFQHLRYLDFSYTQITELPGSIGSLYNLETLLLSGCKNLKELPSQVCSLVNLRHLDLKETSLTEMPSNFGELKVLEVLTDFFVKRDSGSNISELGKLPKLHGSLSVTNLQDVTQGCDALAAHLKDKKHLVSLEFKWTTGNQRTQNEMESEQVVLIMLQPHEYLERLTIKNFGGLQFPTWLRDSSLCNLMCLTLTDCRNCTSLPSLGKLPSLSELRLAKFTTLKTVGQEFYGRDIRSFLSLRMLQFEDMLMWEKWFANEVEGGEFPSLVQLTLQRCPLLTGELPLSLNLSVRVKIVECPLLQLQESSASVQV